MKVIIMHQTIANHDAIGTDIEIMYSILKKKYECVCYADNAFNKNLQYIDSIEEMETLLEDSQNLIIYHHSVYWEEGERLLEKVKGKLIFRYHNITPENFFVSYNKFHYDQCKLGREQTKRFIEKFPKSFWLSDSLFNVEDLEGVSRFAVCPPFNKIEQWANSPIKESIVKELIESDDINLLFVGRVAPNKGHLFLLEVLRWYCTNFDTNIKLYIVGKFDDGISGYNQQLQDKIQRYGLENNVKFIGEISDSILISYYMGCDIFACASEHEGFCVPIVEAQYFMLPIIAVKGTAIQETLGKEQLVLERDAKRMAAAIKILRDNKEYRQYIKSIGKINFETRFSKTQIEKRFKDVLNNKIGISI